MTASYGSGVGWPTTVLYLRRVNKGQHTLTASYGARMLLEEMSCGDM